MSKKARIRILCVDDHQVVREGIAAIVSKENDMEVVAFAGNGLVAEQQFHLHRPDVTLMDLRLPGWSGLEAIRRIRHEEPDARIIVLTMYEGEEDRRRASDAGATAYLLKDTLSEHLVKTIREVHAAPPASAVKGAGGRKSQPMTLSTREEEIVRLMGEGLRNKEIGSALGITEGTVEQHAKRIFAKLQVHDRTAALSVAIRRGIIHIE
jgi:DNA-binding NarL/FixJ family response regulator